MKKNSSLITARVPIGGHFLIIRLLPAIAVLVVHMESAANAAAPPGPYFNGFERDTAGWFDGADRAIIRQHSGYMNGGNYASGIPSADGQWHARLTDTTGCRYNCDGAFTRWGGYSSTFPTGGYLTQLDIYLDVNWAAAHTDYRFDWISAINDNTGQFLRDFVFNVGTGPGFFQIQTSTNSTRSGANPFVPCPNPTAPPNSCRPAVVISTSGWYTFRHTFRDHAGTLAVDFDIFPHGTTTPILHETIFADPMSVVGGNRYGWFSNEEIPDLAIDNSLRTGLCHSGDGDGDVEERDSHKMHHQHFHKNSTCGGQGGEEDNVNSDDEDSGSHFESNSVQSSTFTADEDSQAVTMIGTGTHDGLPVGFTMIAVDNGNLAPGVFTLILTDGYAFTGDLTSGTIAIH
jgi:hypothetical protein